MLSLNGSTLSTISRRLTRMAKPRESKPESSKGNSSDNGSSGLSCSCATCWNKSRIFDRTFLHEFPPAVFLASLAREFPRRVINGVGGPACGRVICSIRVRRRVTPSNRCASGSGGSAQFQQPVP